MIYPGEEKGTLNREFYMWHFASYSSFSVPHSAFLVQITQQPLDH